MRVVLCTGGFDPLHSGHISYLNAAKKLGDVLVVGINSDEWLSRKKGRAFMPLKERFSVVSALGVVDEVIVYNDDDNSSCDAIKLTRLRYPNACIVFANGGDRTENNIPEMETTDTNVEFVFGVGGADKKNSSSWLLEEWKSPKTYRPRGWYRVLEDKTTYKIKELVILPGYSLSMQRHFKRNEHWYVLKGQCKLVTKYKTHESVDFLTTNSSFTVGKTVWHQAVNEYKEPCHILEVQYGEICVEEDIERQ